MINEYIKSLINECIAAAIPENPPVAKLVDINESTTSKTSATKDKCEHLRRRLDECNTVFSEKFEELKQLESENRELRRHVDVMHTAFNDLLQKYQKVKTVILCFRQKEEIIKKQLQAAEGSIEKIEEKYHLLKAHVNTELEKANTDIWNTRKRNEAELTKYTNMVKGMEMKYTHTIQDLEQKTKELNSLTALYDEISGKVKK